MPRSSGATQLRSLELARAGARPRRREPEIMEVAARIFFERGYAQATVQDVADALGILKGSLYHYIRTKEDLLFLVFEHVHREVGELLDEVRVRHDLAPLQRLELFARRQAAYNVEMQHKMAVYYREIDQISPARLREIPRFGEAKAWALELIRDAQARNEIARDEDARLLVEFFFNTLISLHRWYRPQDSSDQAEVVEMCARYAVRGLLGAAPLDPSA